MDCLYLGWIVKYLVYATILLEVDVLDSTTKAEDIKQTVKKRVKLQLDGQRAMKLKDIGSVLVVSGGG